jgi:hypothetical protein
MHATLPDFHLFPPVAHTTQQTPGGSHDILIPSMVPNEEITVSYLYFPPLMAGQVNAGIKSDEGFAAQVPMRLQRQIPRWAGRTLFALTVFGVVAILYVAYAATVWGMAHAR